MDNFKVGDRVTAEYRNVAYDGVVSQVLDYRGIKSVYIADPATGFDIFAVDDGDSFVTLTKCPPPSPPKPRTYYPSSISHTRRA